MQDRARGKNRSDGGVDPGRRLRGRLPIAGPRRDPAGVHAFPGAFDRREVLPPKQAGAGRIVSRRVAVPPPRGGRPLHVSVPGQGLPRAASADRPLVRVPPALRRGRPGRGPGPLGERPPAEHVGTRARGGGTVAPVDADAPPGRRPHEERGGDPGGGTAGRCIPDRAGVQPPPREDQRQVRPSAGGRRASAKGRAGDPPDVLRVLLQPRQLLLRRQDGCERPRRGRDRGDRGGGEQHAVERDVALRIASGQHRHFRARRDSAGEGSRRGPDEHEHI